MTLDGNLPSSSSAGEGMMTNDTIQQGHQAHDAENPPPPRITTATAAAAAATGCDDTKTSTEDSSGVGGDDEAAAESTGASSGPPPPLSKLLGLARPELFPLLVAFFFMVAAEATGLINPILIAQAYDTLVDSSLTTDEKMSDISKWMGTALLVHAAGMVAGFLRSAIMGVAGERVVARLRLGLYGSILSQDISFFDSTKTGELVSRLGSDTTLVQQATSLAVPEVILGVTKVVVAIGLMFWLSFELAGFTIGLVFVIFVVVVPFGKKIGSLAKRYQDALGKAQDRSTEALGGIRTVQSFAAEKRERKRYKEKIGSPDDYPWWIPLFSDETTYSVGFSKSIWTSGFFIFLFGVGFGAMYAALWFGFRLVVDEKMTLGDLTAFQSYIFQIGGGLAHTSRFVAQLMEARGASGRIFNLLERIPAIPGPGIDKGTESTSKSNDGSGSSSGVSYSMPIVKPPSMIGAVELRNVFFSYPSRPGVPVLRDFTLTIPPNTTAALVGASGAGKSTVVSLLQRFYDIDGGSITIDGIDIRSLDLQWLRSHIGCVQQEPQLFGMTIRENVCYGLDRQVSQDEVVAACREANAHDFITSWPSGYDTLVGERGVKLSGGQKQRIGIARALLVNPKILLLDEATAALDSESEHLVQQAIDKAVVGRTVLLVAHRLSTIQNAQQIIVVDNQQIQDVGTHDVLLRRCSKYQDLIKRQSVVRPL